MVQRLAVILAAVALSGVMVWAAFGAEPTVEPGAVARPAAPVAGAVPTTRPATAQPVAPLEVEKLALIGLLRDSLFRHPGRITSIALVDGGKTILTSSTDGVRLWEAASGKELRHLHHENEGGATSVLAVQPIPGDGRKALSSGADQQVTLWDLGDNKALRTMPHATTVTCLAVTPDGKRAFAGDWGEKITQWNLETGEKIGELGGHTSSVYGLALSPDGKTLVSASQDKTIRVWDAASGEVRQVLEGHDRWGTAVAFSPRGGQFASAACDQTVRLWDAAGKELWRSILVEMAGGIALDPQGEVVAVACRDRSLRLLAASSGKVRCKIDLPAMPDGPVLFSADGTEVYCAAAGCLTRWDCATGRRLGSPAEGGPELAPAQIFHLALSPDGQRLYGAGVSTALLCWDLRSGALQDAWDLGRDPYFTSTVAVSPDGKRLLTANGIQATVLDAATGKTVLQLPNTYAAVWGPTSASMVAQSLHGPAVWDIDKPGSRPLMARVPAGDIFVLASSADGQQVALAWDGKVQRWNLTTGTELSGLICEGPDRSAGMRARFTPDGRGLLMGSHVGWVRYWQFSTKPAVGLDRAALAAWVKDLGSEDYPVREAATARLIAAGPEAEAAFDQADKNDPEVVDRIERIRLEWQKGPTSNHDTRSTLELKAPVGALAVHPDGRHWAAVVGLGADAEVVLGELTGGRPSELRRIKDARHACGLCFSADGKTLYVGNRDATVSIYRAE